MVRTYAEGLSATLEHDPCYKAISAVYGDKTTKRTGVKLMSHINEGLEVLNALREEHRGDISLPVLQAYCLHPIFQDDESLSVSWKMYPSALLQDISVDAVMLAMEYRNIANSYLASRKIKDISEIKLSPLNEVQSMLIADKVQNRKDFEQYHKGKHESSEILEEYFSNWFKRLGITEEWYGKMIEKLEKI